MATHTTDDRARCPNCGKRLNPLTRVRKEMVPATVPDYLPREEQAIYRRVESYTLAECPKGHRFQQVGPGLNASLTSTREATW